MFSKKKDSKIADAQEYLRSTDNVSRPTAILMSLVAFVAVFAIVFSLFLGGRWLYDWLRDESSRDDTTQVVTTNGTTEADSSEQNSDQNNGLGITVIGGNGEEIASDVGSRLNQPQETPVNTPQNTQVAGATDQLPNTGPASNALIIAVSVVLATAAHNLYLRKRSE